MVISTPFGGAASLDKNQQICLGASLENNHIGDFSETNLDLSQKLNKK